MSRLRIGLLLVLVVLRIYSGSVFSPWAESELPRLWLYDTLFYAGYLLFFWWGAEALRLIVVRRRTGSWRRAAVPLALLLAAAVLPLANFALHRTAAGWRMRVELSAPSLRSHKDPVIGDRRHRAGWLIIDSVRAPCGDQAWLWLGRPFGGGTGINLALVHSPPGPPLSPLPEAFRFRRVNDQWWMAYQNPRAYRRGRGYSAEDCVAGIVVETHRAGMRYIAD